MKKIYSQESENCMLCQWKEQCLCGSEPRGFKRLQFVGLFVICRFTNEGTNGLWYIRSEPTFLNHEVIFFTQVAMRKMYSHEASLRNGQPTMYI